MMTTQADIELQSFEYDSTLETYWSSFDEETTSPSMAVIATISEVLERSPMEWGPLGEIIDMDALDQLSHSRSGIAGNVSVTFTIYEHTVTVYDAGEITVTSDEDGRMDEPTGGVDTK